MIAEGSQAPSIPLEYFLLSIKLIKLYSNCSSPWFFPNLAYFPSFFHSIFPYIIIDLGCLANQNRWTLGWENVQPTISMDLGMKSFFNSMGRKKQAKINGPWVSSKPNPMDREKMSNPQISMDLGTGRFSSRWNLKNTPPQKKNAKINGPWASSQPKSMDLGLRKCLTHQYRWTLGWGNVQFDGPWKKKARKKSIGPWVSSKPKSMNLGRLANQNQWTLGV